MKYFLLLIIFLLILGCQTASESTNIEEISENIENSIKPEELESEESIELYDLTVLKGGNYPKIKGSITFTDIEIEILKNTNGLELEASLEVAHYFKYFLYDKRDLIELWLNNASLYIPEIRKEFEKHSLPMDLIYLPFLESGYNPMAYSRVGAGGIWQFMPKTAQSYGLIVDYYEDQRRSPQLATPYAIKHLIHLYNRFGNWYTALAAYNAGEGRISRAMDNTGITDYFELIKTDILPMETRKYVIQYMAILKIMKNLERLGLDEIDWEKSDNKKTITLRAGRNLLELSKSINMEWKDFRKLNPSFRRYTTSPYRTSDIYIPGEKYELAIGYLNKTKIVKKTVEATNFHRVKAGDTLFGISIKYNIKLETIYKLNNLTDKSVLKVGQIIKLPNIEGSDLKVHRIASGDTLLGISYKYNIPLKKIIELNAITDPERIRVGDVIRLY